MAHPYAGKAKTGQQIADRRYDQKSAKGPHDPVLEEARKDPHYTQPEEVFTAAPARQISNSGKVRK